MLYRQTNRTGFLFLLWVRIERHANRSGILILLWVRNGRQTNWTGFLYWLWVRIVRQVSDPYLALGKEPETDKHNRDPRLHWVSI